MKCCLMLLRISTGDAGSHRCVQVTPPVPAQDNCFARQVLGHSVDHPQSSRCQISEPLLAASQSKINNMWPAHFRLQHQAACGCLTGQVVSDSADSQAVHLCSMQPAGHSFYQMVWSLGIVRHTVTKRQRESTDKAAASAT